VTGSDQRLRRFHVACPLGLEEVTANELRALRPVVGTAPQDVEVVGHGGVAFRGDLRTGYAANLWLRTAIRVQEELISAEGIEDRDALYDLASHVDWNALLTPDTTFAFDAHSRDSFARDARFAALVCKDALVDAIRERAGRRPSVDRTKPEMPLKVVALADRVAIYRNYTHRSLHKRGYRPVQTKGPLAEVLAAGLLQLAGFGPGGDVSRSLLDPMCGSGTFAIEAAWIAADRAPGLTSRFAFERWPDFDERAWQDLLEEARQRARVARKNVPPIEAADRHPGALDIARASAEAAGVGSAIRFHDAEVSALRPRTPPRLVVANPPYGARLGSGDDLEQSWRDLGAFVRGLESGAEAYVLSGSPELTRHLGMRATQKWRILNGSLDCRWLRYPVAGEPRSDGGSGPEAG
jgi:23S rRNA G2445 N2-methylase RlmL